MNKHYLNINCCCTQYTSKDPLFYEFFLTHIHKTTYFFLTLHHKNSHTALKILHNFVENACNA